jgi:hypothetical protein
MVGDAYTPLYHPKDDNCYMGEYHPSDDIEQCERYPL